VIDNKIAYTGGINLADEYINRKHLFGHWRDAAVRVEGSAAKSFTLMFLQMWNLLSKSPKPVTEPMPEQTETLFEGWILPYTDHPTESIHTGEHIFLHSIQRAQSKLYITTPYLMIGDELIAALKNAAQSGVDVRIITPGIPDKKLIYLTTRSYYRDLIEAGVKIYEYTPGFIHSKNLICDDDFCVVGTSNMDYRSLYVNFECGACFYDAPIVEDVKRDMEEVLSLSHEVTVADCKVNFLQGILQDICRLFANIM
jgi:cardiolipin synthase